MVSFSSALLSAINKVKATRALSAKHRGIGSPDAELGTTLRFNPIAHRNDYIQVITTSYPFYLSIAFFLNYPEFPDS
jgi:hypothetical protein